MFASAVQSVDFVMAFLPALAWVVIWGALTGILSMLVYWRLSPQTRLAEITCQATVARRELQSFDGDDIRVYGQLTARALALSLTQVRLVVFPTLLAMIPVRGHRCLWNGDRQIQCTLRHPCPDAQVGRGVPTRKRARRARRSGRGMLDVPFQR